MASEKQYDFFKLLYDEESAREKQLNEGAKHLMSLATLYSAFAIYAVKDAQFDRWDKVGFGIAIGLMLVTFLAALMTLRVKTFEAITTPRRALKSFGKAPLSDAAFYDRRIADLVVATERNCKVNDRKARMLALAGSAAPLAIFAQAAFFIWLA
jgi:hypothetical protein